MSARIKLAPLVAVVLFALAVLATSSSATFRAVQLPRQSGEAPRTEGDVELVLRADSSIEIRGRDSRMQLAPNELVRGLRAHAIHEREYVFLDADPEVPWGDVIATIDTLRAIAPSSQVSLVDRRGGE